MTIKDILANLAKAFAYKSDIKSSLIFGKYVSIIIYLLLVITFFISYTLITNHVDDKNLSNRNNVNELSQNKSFGKIIDHFFSGLNNPYVESKYIIQNNDSVQKILDKFNIDDKEIQLISSKLVKKNMTNIYAGRELSIIYKVDENGKKNHLVSLFYPVTNTQRIEIVKNQEDFEIRENILQLYKKETIVEGTIQNNLYSAAISAGIEPNVIIEFARIYGFEIDFQRDIRKGDTFEIFYEKFVDDNNIVRDTGKIVFTSVNFNNREINLYNFKDKDEDGYYDINGKSIVKSLMKTPINGARLSSAFGMRKHPILGFNKKHFGTDFAAPAGTPIMASGSGTVIKAGWCGGGGNCVKIKHNSTYETVYAHMRSFAKGIKKGKKVSQGRIIGYVGSTGMSTGPHLHYEVHVNKKKVNSQTLKLPSGKILKGEQRKNFEIERIKIDLKLAELKDN